LLEAPQTQNLQKKEEEKSPKNRVLRRKQGSTFWPATECINDLRVLANDSANNFGITVL